MAIAKRVDDNQAEIVHALRLAGASVECLHVVGGGVPDLLVGYRGQNYLLEVKSAGGKPNALQQQWHRSWDGQVASVWTAEGALRVLGCIEPIPDRDDS